MSAEDCRLYTAVWVCVLNCASMKTALKPHILWQLPLNGSKQEKQRNQVLISGSDGTMGFPMNQVLPLPDVLLLYPELNMK